MGLHGQALLPGIFIQEGIHPIPGNPIGPGLSRQGLEAPTLGFQRMDCLLRVFYKDVLVVEMIARQALPQRRAKAQRTFSLVGRILVVVDIGAAHLRQTFGIGQGVELAKEIPYRQFVVQG